MKTKVTNEKLGNVALRIKELDVERFKRLTEGMVFFGTAETSCNNHADFVENDGGEWLSSKKLDIGCKIITLDELESLLFPKEEIIQKINESQ